MVKSLSSISTLQATTASDGFHDDVDNKRTGRVIKIRKINSTMFTYDMLSLALEKPGRSITRITPSVFRILRMLGDGQEGIEALER